MEFTGPLFSGRVVQAIILAGGLGTRLRDTVPDLPKCMAPVAGRPFLFYVINYLRSQGIEQFIFSTGYKYEKISDYLVENFSTLNYSIVIEDEPLGTGGAINLTVKSLLSSTMPYRPMSFSGLSDMVHSAFFVVCKVSRSFTLTLKSVSPFTTNTC